MNILWVFGVGFIGIMGFLVLRKGQPEFAQLIPVLAVILLFIALLPKLEEVFSLIQILGENSGVSSDGISVVLRGVGICLVTRVASGICIDCGQRALGDTVDYCGQIALVLLALPLITQLAERLMSVSFH